MYAAVNELHKSGRSYDCQKGNARHKAGIDYANIIYTPKASRWQYSNAYSKLTIIFEGL